VATDFRELLRTGRWFGSLPEVTQEMLLAHAGLRAFPAGRTVSSPSGAGDGTALTGEGLHAVVDGSILLRTVDQRGSGNILMFMDPPSWFGEGAVIERPAAQLETVAAVDSLLIAIPLRKMRALLSRDPLLWQHLARLASYHLQLALMALGEASAKPLARVARRLGMMVEGYGDHRVLRRAIRIKQEHLARTLGMSRQTVNRLLKLLEHRRLIRLRYGEIELLDHAGVLSLGASRDELPKA
jgi:CRP-like cAMP-binding protein